MDSNHYSLNTDIIANNNYYSKKLTEKEITMIARNLLKPIKSKGHVIQTSSKYTCEMLCEEMISQ